MPDHPDVRPERDTNGGWRPVPDPTVLTTLSLQREIAALREVLEKEIQGDRSVIETRLNSMDTAITLLRTSTTDQVPQLIETKIGHLERLHNEKFNSMKQEFEGVTLRFDERDVRAEQTTQAAKEAVATAFLASKEAVAAALQAAKEAVGAQSESFSLATSKAEAATSKLLDALGTQIQTSTLGLESKISDLKDRLGTIEGHSGGMQQSWVVMVAAIGMIGTLVAVAVAIYTLGHRG